MKSTQLGWYVARARRMSPTEVPLRVVEQARRQAWRRHRVKANGGAARVPTRVSAAFPTTLDAGAARAVPERAQTALIGDADRLLAGSYAVLGADRTDLVAPDWFLDPVSGRRAPDREYAFDIPHRSEAHTGNVKQVWELSRHQHLTLLAAAFFVTDDERYAERVAEHLSSWWTQNPFLTGIHWTSGIEVGLRLVAWTWIRRLLDGWHDIGELFDHNDIAARQLAWHQRYLRGFESRGSSANNHAIAEAAGQLVAACAFPWFEESARWRADAALRLRRTLAHNTFSSGINRELATEYHGFVTELAYTAAIEAECAGVALGDDTWTLICRMTDAAAALTDTCGRPPRQGDGDAGVALRVDGNDARTPAWAPLLALGGVVFGRQRWWPCAEGNVYSTLLGSLAGPRRCIAKRPSCRPDHFADAGITLLRTEGRQARDPAEIWCRCDAGPHGFLATAAHAHADALSVEVRHGGVDVLADPGTYCYHTEPTLRSYFRSTRAHNTLEVAGLDQSRSGGPFLWLRAAGTRLVHLEYAQHGNIVGWCAEHDGYATRRLRTVHRRSVALDATRRALTIVDRVDSTARVPIRLFFHLGPAIEVDVEVDCNQATAALRWCASTATMHLPPELEWNVRRGDEDPPCGWYSPSFGTKTPSATLVGFGHLVPPGVELRTTLELDDACD